MHSQLLALAPNKKLIGIFAKVSVKSLRDPKPELTGEDCLELLSRTWVNLATGSSPIIVRLMRRVIILFNSIDQLRLMIRWIWGGAKWGIWVWSCRLQCHRWEPKAYVKPPTTSSSTLPLLNSAAEDKCAPLHILSMWLQIGPLFHLFVCQLLWISWKLFSKVPQGQMCPTSYFLHVASYSLCATSYSLYFSISLSAKSCQW